MEQKVVEKPFVKAVFIMQCSVVKHINSTKSDLILLNIIVYFIIYNYTIIYSISYKKIYVFVCSHLPHKNHRIHVTAFTTY